MTVRRFNRFRASYLISAFLAGLWAFSWGGPGNSSGVARAGSLTWTEPLTGMEFVRVEGGCGPFTCGDGPGAGSEKHAPPGNEVCVDGFWLGKTEVTRAQFEVFVKSTGYRTDAERDGYSWVYTGEWSRRPGVDWRNPGFEQDGRSPVLHVSWNDAREMAAWLSKESKGAFRLPSEAEWEYACKAGAKDEGRSATDEPICSRANIADLAAARVYPAWKTVNCEDGFVYTAPVGSFRPNGFGLYDMLGNVWEWCEDVCGQSDRSRPEKRQEVKPGSGNVRIIRGGSWYSGSAACSMREVLQSGSRRSSDIGFRLFRAE
jgi:formylglycine-generating enzyme